MRKTFTIVFISVALVTACSDEIEKEPATNSVDNTITSPDTNTSTTGVPDDPCVLVTNEEMGLLLNNQVQATKINTTLCEYSLVKGTGVTSDIFINAASSSDCEIELSVGGFDKNPTINGLGKLAYWKLGGTTHQAIVCTGEAFLVVTLYQLPGSDKMTDETSLATARGIVEKALARL